MSGPSNIQIMTPLIAIESLIKLSLKKLSGHAKALPHHSMVLITAASAHLEAA